MNTNLILTKNSPLRTVIVNESTKQPIYSIETPRKLNKKVTKIRKVGHVDNPALVVPFLLEDSDNDNNDSDDETVDDMRSPLSPSTTATEDEPGLDEVARIHWHHLTPDRLVLHGQSLDRNTFLPKSGLLGRAFKFEVDGVRFKWDLGPMGMFRMPKLVLDDGSDTLVAQFYRKNPVVNKRNAYLEVSPLGMEILDHVILTFVLVEDRRRDRENGLKFSVVVNIGRAV